jgi:large subunit ribosomal protein L22
MAGYAFNGMKENMVKASGRNLNISPKQSIEICSYIRGRPLTQAKGLLQLAIDEKRAVPLKRFTNGPGHKPGIAAGRFYPKACTQILKTLESAESNAKNKGMNVSDLRIAHIAAQRAPKQQHYGRKRRSIFKAAHIEVVLEEVKGLTSKNTKKPQAASVEKKTDKPKPKPAPKTETHSHEGHATHEHTQAEHPSHSPKTHTEHKTQ